MKSCKQSLFLSFPYVFIILTTLVQAYFCRSLTEDKPNDIDDSEISANAHGKAE